MTHAEKARAYFLQGYNCAQSVFTAYCDVTGMDEKTALRLSSSFGGGMGRLREVCGACTGIFMACGMVLGYDQPGDDTLKGAHYALIQQMAHDFQQKHGTYICRELLENHGVLTDSAPAPSARTPEYYASRPCVHFLEDAANILDAVLKEKGKL